ncbi:hypothetical protein C7293_18150 [filamentous cyanobacterium CCT1]|nr:hypothetical protein C7293_18150 [filamentous cyanobacterium CCT1]PSN81236.1 hypothetical protein C8B47_02490 [filamentous cyanobacterium CCP4]
MPVFLSILALTLLVELALSGFFTLLPGLGKSGQLLSQQFTQAPWLDVALGLLIWLPWIAGAAAAGWLGLGAVLIGQIVALQLWILGHEQMHRQALKGPRIVGYLNQRFGWWRNNMALWVTSISLPLFFGIRAAEVLLYPLLVKLLGFRNYDHSEWINISRQKFEGLVGHDLIWCLYCDWMTGVYSLGAEMLRNVESFWCPIRFYNGKKCENCQLDFPDINGGWVAADSTMIEVVETLDQQMPQGRPWSWFGHPNKWSDPD